jgi:hypothetical protein
MAPGILDDDPEEYSAETDSDTGTSEKTYRISWEANREHGVNSTGGGYRVHYSTTKAFIAAKTFIAEVPYRSGTLAPTQTLLNLTPGTWYIRVAGFSSYNGGTQGAFSDAITLKGGP